jgi:hypothetical protein
MFYNFDGLWWLLLLLGPLVIFQRRLHRELQAVFLLVTRRIEIALLLFSFLFFPGVFLHEVSHFLMARLLGVRTGRLSLIPRTLDNGRLQMGYVETASTDIFRDALIGAAPLIVGGLFVAYAGLVQLRLTDLWSPLTGGELATVIDKLETIYSRPDFWLWFYLAFTTSSTMLPSASDRRAWLPLAFVVGLLLGVSVLAGAGPWMVANLATPFNNAMRSVAVVIAISLLLHTLVLLPMWGLRILLSRLLKLKVV